MFPPLCFSPSFGNNIFGRRDDKYIYDLLNASVKIQLLSVGYKAENISVIQNHRRTAKRVALQPRGFQVSGQSDAAVERPTDVETGDIKTVARLNRRPEIPFPRGNSL